MFYGSTEAGPGTTLADHDLARKPGSVGRRPAPGVRRCRLEPSDGEVCLRGAFLMNGYFEDPDGTAEALVDGWYHTGDLGVARRRGLPLDRRPRARRDPHRRRDGRAGRGRGRARRHPAVAEVAVVGVPDAEWGEVVCAVVVVGAGDAASTSTALRAHCDGRLAGFKHPRRLEVVDALPRTAATGQIQRTLLVERLQSGIAF